MRYNKNNSKNPAKIMPWEVGYPRIKQSYDLNEVLPVGISQIRLWSPVTGLNPKLNRGKFLTDRRVKVQAISVPKAALVVEFNFEDYIREEVGTLTTLAEIGRVLSQVESAIREEVLPEFTMQAAGIVSVSIFRKIIFEAVTDRCMKLLYLLSRDRGGKDLEDTILRDPGVPHWLGAYAVVFDKAYGRQSKVEKISKAAVELRFDQLRFEAKRTYELNDRPVKDYAMDLLAKFPSFLHNYADCFRWPFELSLRQISDIEQNRSREERAVLQQNNRDYYDPKAFRPFRDQRNIDLIAELKTRLYDFSTVAQNP